MPLLRFKIGDWVRWDYPAYRHNNHQGKIQIRPQPIKHSGKGQVVGVTYMYDGHVEWDDVSEYALRIFTPDKGHMVYLVRTTMRGTPVKVLPDSLTPLPDPGILPFQGSSS